MRIGDFIRFRFPFHVEDYLSPWRYGIIVNSCDLINETVDVLSSGQIIKVHIAVIELQQEV